MLKHILFCFVLFVSCNSNETNNISKTINKESINEGVLVSVYITKLQTFKKQLISNGKIEAKQKSDLHFKTTERIAAIKVKNGQTISEGQLLARLDNNILANQLQKATLEFDKAKSKLQEEKINFGLIDTENKIDPLILKNLQINSGYLDAQNNLEKAQLLYNQTLLKSPFNGVVANLETKEGNYITSSDVFCTIISNKKLEVTFSILENELPFIKIWQEIEITPFTASESKYVGKVSEINPLIDKNGLIKIKATIINSSISLFDGMNVKILINQPINNIVVVPKEALVLRSNKEVVFTVKSGLAKWNYVEVLDENSKSYALKNGISIGDTVIVSGNMNLSHDAKVDITFASIEEDSN